MKYALLEITKANIDECAEREMRIANMYFADPYTGNCPRNITELYIDDDAMFELYEKYMEDRPKVATFTLHRFTEKPKPKKKRKAKKPEPKVAKVED